VGDYPVVLRSMSGKRFLVSSVTAAVSLGLILWPAAAAGGHSSASAAAPLLAGDLDSSFGSAGVVTQSPGDPVGIAVQPDGKVVVAGGAVRGSGFLLARYLPDGSPDPSFGEGGYVPTGPGLPVGRDDSGAVALQPDGKIVVAGESSVVSPSCQGNTGVCAGFALARFDPNGSLDTSFGTNGITNTFFPGAPNGAPNALSWSFATTLALLPGGEIVAGGVSVSQISDAWSSFALAEYTPAGSLDPTFGAGGIVQTAFTQNDAGITSLAVRPGGKIVATGSDVSAGHGDHTYLTALARYEPDGSLDPGFGTAGKMETTQKLSYMGGPSVEQNGKIVVAGYRSNDLGYASFPVVARFGPGGRLDSSFGNRGYEEIRSLAGDAATAIATQPDGKILLATNSANFDVKDALNTAVVRLLPNGSPDPSFGRKGVATLSVVGCIGGGECRSAGLAVQADGNVLVSEQGGFPGESNSSLTLARLIGGNNCVVPGLRGRTISKARATLKASYCNTGGISRLFSNKVARGRVITTSPIRGDRRPTGTKVDLVVSRGKRAGGP
jgi:uncharacterized delta-60 repeat protein